MACDTSNDRLPKLLAKQIGERFTQSVCWDDWVASEGAITDYTATVTDAPDGAPNIIEADDISGNNTVLTVNLDSAPEGVYSIEETITFTSGVIEVQCFSLEVRPC